MTGRPRLDPGVTLWHDANGWHVRVTHNAIHDRVFSGVIHTSGTLTDVHSVRLEKNDYVKVGSGGHTLAFRFNNYGGVDGFDFTTTARRTSRSASRPTVTCWPPRTSRSVRPDATPRTTRSSFG